LKRLLFIIYFKTVKRFCVETYGTREFPGYRKNIWRKWLRLAYHDVIINWSIKEIAPPQGRFVNHPAKATRPAIKVMLPMNNQI